MKDNSPVSITTGRTMSNTEPNTDVKCGPADYATPADSPAAGAVPLCQQTICTLV